jgi:multiple sugar transport system permease protein
VTVLSNARRSAAATIVVAPVIVLFFFTQRTFIQGITVTGLKG